MRVDDGPQGSATLPEQSKSVAEGDRHERILRTDPIRYVPISSRCRGHASWVLSVEFDD